MKTSSKITFKINRSSIAYLGLCYRNRIEAQEYCVKCKLFTTQPFTGVECMCSTAEAWYSLT